MLFWKWVVGISLAAVPFLGCGQRSQVTNPAPVVVQNTLGSAPSWEGTNNPLQPAEDASAAMSLENASAQVVSRGLIPTNVLSSASAEIVKLAHAGVDESVMLAFVTNSSKIFELTSDNIVYLNDVGVPGSVVTAMIQRDRDLGFSSLDDEEIAAAAATDAPTNVPNQLVPTPGAPVPYATATPTGMVETQLAPDEAVEAAPIPAPQPQQVNVSYTYFYDSLAPYGTWIDVDGYGLCWQPTVVAVDRSWQPYVHRGRWVYTDCGWYWASDYSWGWAPFHYGRWFRHARFGWCWAPDTVWGPAWVSWRYSSDYCGWAPLPPTACYRPGIGFTYYGRPVGFSFGFGISYNSYCFVPVRNLCDRQVHHHRLGGYHVRDVYYRTQPLHRYDRDDRNRLVNRGIPVERVREVTRRDIRPIPTRDIDRPSAPRIERGARDRATELAVYRPRLPEPNGNTRLVGEGVRPADRPVIPRNETLIRPNPAVTTPAGANISPRNDQQPATARVTPRANDRGQQIVRPTPANPTGSSDQPSRIENGQPDRQNNTPRITRDTTRDPNRREPLILRGSHLSESGSQTPSTPAPVTGDNGSPATPQPTTPTALANPGRQFDRTIPRGNDGGSGQQVRPVQPGTSGGFTQPANPTPTRQLPNRQPPQTIPIPQTAPTTPPTQVQPQPTQPNQRIYRVETPRQNNPVRVVPQTPAITPIPRQNPSVAQPVPRQDFRQSVPNYQPATPTPTPQPNVSVPQRSFSPPRSIQPEVRTPRVESPVRNMAPPQTRQAAPSMQPSPTPAPQPQREIRSDRSGGQRQAPVRNDGGRRNR